MSEAQKPNPVGKTDKKLVLVVEDDPMFRYVLRTFLEAEGFAVEEADQGNSAVALLKTKTVDLIISDTQMPQMDGISLLAWVKENTKSKFVLMTGFSEVIECQQAYKLGADEFLAKPFRKEELVQILKECLVPPVTQAPPTALVRDVDYCQIQINDFITGSELTSDIYLRLTDDRYIKLASEGQTVPTERIAVYKSKGINHLYMKKEDFARYVGFNLRLLNAVQGTVSVDLESKRTLVKHVTDNLMEQLCSDGLQKQRLYDASLMVVNSIDLLFSNQATHQFMTFLMKGNTLSEHAIGVAMLASLMAKDHDWNAQSTTFKVTLAGLFHEIGSKEIPEAIMNKPRFELTPDECRLMESHTLRGRDILNSIPGLPEDVAAVAAQHHESMSGHGYPRRLKGDQIHPIARLIAVADTFCDLVLATPYKKGMTPEQAYQTIRYDYQTDLDPVFVRLLRNIVEPGLKNGKKIA